MLNEQQKAAVEARGQSLIVSAAAGSGKTKVLIERLVSIIAESDPEKRTSIEEIVVVTFTNAAAAEIKTRLSEALSEKRSTEPDNFWLMEQEIAVKSAKISTIHTFCYDLIRENAYKLGINQGFRIANDNEIKIFVDRACTYALEKQYYEQPQDMGFLVDVLTTGDDSNLLFLLKDFLKFSDNICFFEDWLENYSPDYEFIKHIVEKMLTEKGTVTEVKVAKKSKSKDKEEEEIAKIQDALNHFEEDIVISERIFSILKRLIIDTKRKLWELKCERNVLYHDDAERLTLELLSVKIGGKRQKSDLAAALSNEYKHILIDEYQDVNDSQDMIFKLISNGKNLFLVGDVKQAIYGFRGANPHIFTDIINNAVDYDGEGGDKFSRIYLNTNYRSSQNVVDFVNKTFDNLMTKELGGTDYTEKEKLYLGAEFPENDRKTEIIQLAKDDNEQEAVAAKIRECIDRKIQVTDRDGKTRDCTYKDFCILCRKSAPAEKFINALDERGINATGEAEVTFLGSREIVVLVNLLKVIDNPLLDKEFLSVVLSPMYTFSIDEVTEIRQFDRKKHFYSLFLESKNPKAVNFINELRKFRRMSSRLTISDLITEIYDSTDFLNIMQIFTDANQKKANLRLLLEIASQYSDSGNSSLSGFLRYLAQIKTISGDWKAGKAVIPTTNSVKFMTIHKSKGLEFPFVFLIGTDSKFRIADKPFDPNRGYNVEITYRFHKKAGIGFVLHSNKDFVKYTTAQFLAIKSLENAETLSEEMRLLYVALTRAKEKLFITRPPTPPPNSMSAWLNR